MKQPRYHVKITERDGTDTAVVSEFDTNAVIYGAAINEDENTGGFCVADVPNAEDVVYDMLAGIFRVFNVKIAQMADELGDIAAATLLWNTLRRAAKSEGFEIDNYCDDDDDDDDDDVDDDETHYING